MEIDLLLVGFGNVGRRFARLLEERRAFLAGALGLEPRIVGIATGTRGAVFDPDGLDSHLPLEAERVGALADGLELIATAAAHRGTHPRVVVETTPLNIDTARPALDHVRAALRSRMHVITANKGPVAFAYGELRQLSREMGVQFLYEGAVMDGIPIFNLVRETMPAMAITGFRGVVNSTTNYIITRMEEGEEYAAALREMQLQGIAEADPTLDVEGWDAAAKTAALVNVLMGGSITPRDVHRAGITTLTAEHVREAAARNRSIRLVATAWRAGSSIVARVAPEELEPGDALAQLRGMSNALYLETDVLGRVGITQLDGGLTQTAYALFADLVTVGRSLEARPSAQPG